MTTIQGTFNSAVQGMNTEAQALTIISNNISNVTTNGYKNQQYHFQTLLNDVSPTGQQFLAVQDTDFRNVDQQGQIDTTGRTMDLALNGKGLLVTNTASDGTGAWQYTRDGSLQGQAVTLATTSANTGQPDQATLLTTSSGQYVYGWPANADGTFTQTNNLGALQPVQFATNAQFPAQPTTAIGVQANLAASSTGRQTVGLQYIDSDGTSQTLTMGFTGNLANGWTLDGTTTSGATVSLDQSNVTFDGLGNLVTPTGGIVNATINGVDGPQNIAVDLSKLTSLAGNSGITVQNITQNGFISGTLQNTYFTSDGVLMGSYSNNETKPLYKLAVASFQNDAGLTALSGNVYTQSDQSGALTLSGLGNSPTGTQFVVGALEQSTVDLSDQFSRMIVTQRAYSSSAQVLKVADEMTQAARDLER